MLPEINALTDLRVSVLRATVSSGKSLCDDINFSAGIGAAAAVESADQARLADTTLGGPTMTADVPGANHVPTVCTCPTPLCGG
jgi:hypothetical protein